MAGGRSEGDDPVTDTAIRLAFSHLLSAHHDLERAKTERDSAIVEMYLESPAVSGIVRDIDAVLSGLGVPEHRRQGLGASESAIHLALTKAGVKPKRGY